MAISKKALALGVVGGFVGLLILGSLIDDDTGSAPPNPALMQDASDVSANTSMEQASLSVDAANCAVNHVLSYRGEITRAYEAAEQGISSVKKNQFEAPKVTFTAQIPADQLVYWFDTGMSPQPACQYGKSGPTAEYFELLDNPLAAVYAAAKGVLARDGTFVPTKKDDFEKTDEYEARVLQERQAFEAAHSGGAFTAALIGEAWSAVIGAPWIVTINSTDLQYDPDGEVLKFNLVSRNTIPYRDGIPSRPIIEIPVEFALPRDVAKKYSDALGGTIRAEGLEVAAVAMQFSGGTLTIREVSVRPKQFADEYNAAAGPSKLQSQAMQAAGFSLEHIPMNYEFPFRFNN